jgi:hypothetical protein
MSVGFAVDKGVIDGRAGNIVMQLREYFDQVSLLKVWLDATPDTTLQAAPFSYTAPEVATLKSAITDLDNLRKVANGQQAQAQANNFFFWANKLTGIQ